MYNQISDTKVLFEEMAATEFAASPNDFQVKQSSINRIVLDELTLGDSDLLCELIDIYLEQFEQQLQEIKTAIETKNAELLFTVAHKAVGGNATFGMTTVVAPLRQLEKMGKESEFTGASEILNSICREFVAIGQELQTILNEKSS